MRDFRITYNNHWYEGKETGAMKVTLGLNLDWKVQEKFLGGISGRNLSRRKGMGVGRDKGSACMKVQREEAWGVQRPGEGQDWSLRRRVACCKSKKGGWRQNMWSRGSHVKHFVFYGECNGTPLKGYGVRRRQDLKGFVRSLRCRVGLGLERSKSGSRGISGKIIAAIQRRDNDG